MTMRAWCNLCHKEIEGGREEFDAHDRLHRNHPPTGPDIPLIAGAVAYLAGAWGPGLVTTEESAAYEILGPAMWGALVRQGVIDSRNSNA